MGTYVEACDTHTHIYIYPHTYIHTPAHNVTHAHTHVYTPHIDTHIHTHTHEYTYIHTCTHITQNGPFINNMNWWYIKHNEYMINPPGISHTVQRRVVHSLTT